jgi:uncharacterized protein
MELTPLLDPQRRVIEGYGAGSFKVSGRSYEGSVIVMADRVLTWPVASLEAVALESFAPMRSVAPDLELLLLGTGARFALAPPRLRQALREVGIVLEAMATPAACRTYNILIAEDRKVAAALLAMPSA